MGVWIETSYSPDSEEVTVVTPCMGVWIETALPQIWRWLLLSHPVWVCGLKLFSAAWMNTGSPVTPCMGVWIETSLLKVRAEGGFVTPCMGVWIETILITRACRLTMSHPVWVCGLKRFTAARYSAASRVTPCMGVWIETETYYPGSRRHGVTPCMGVWIETNSEGKKRERIASHTLYGCVDWNIAGEMLEQKARGHTLYGCVDWNPPAPSIYKLLKVTPCMGVWIETQLAMIGVSASVMSHPVWVCGLKHRSSDRWAYNLCHTLYGCVDWNIARSIHSNDGYRSHPVWVCGLKHIKNVFYNIKSGSHPVWVCGLKHW